MPAPKGTLTRAMSCSPPCESRTVTRRLSDRLETNGNGWAGIHRQRSYQREDVLKIMLADIGALVIGQFVIGDQADIVLLETLKQLVQNLALTLLHPSDIRVAFRNLLARAAPIGRHFLHSGDHLLFKAADAFHEEFVEIGSRNGQELYPLQQRIARVRSLGENPPVECQPRQFAVEI